MSAEAIGRVIRDFRRGNVLMRRERSFVEHVDWIARSDVVDVTPIYADLLTSAKGSGWALYEDSVVRPPFRNVSYCYVNQWGNVIVVSALSTSRREYDDEWAPVAWESLADDHTIDWDRVEWITVAWSWYGGYSRTVQEYLPTSGPVSVHCLAIYGDGTLADAKWQAVFEPVDGKSAEQEMLATLSVVTKAITFLNCRNVVILEPSRGRAEQRRVARTGVAVNEIHITPVGKYRRSQREPVRLGDSSTPLGTVRGHVAKYGPRWGRGLLFGKYEGEFWIPAHLRGRADVGEVLHEYSLERETL